MTGKIYAQDGDDLSEANINEAAAIANQSDYVVRGLGLTADYSALELDVGAGFCTILVGQQLYRVFPDATTESLAADETHDVYVRIDPDARDDVSIDVRTDGTAPTDPHLLIGTVDTAADTATEENREPDIEAAQAMIAELEAGSAKVSDPPSEPSDVARKSELDAKLDSSAYSPEADTHDQTTSSDIDHQETTNRTHDGDELSPKSVNAEQTNVDVDTDQDNIPLSISETGDRRYDAIKMNTAEAPFRLWRNTSDFNGRTNPRLGLGYNLDTRSRGQDDPSKPAGGWTIEGEYLGGNGTLNQEFHLQGAYDNGDTWRSETTYVEQPSTGDKYILKEYAVSEYQVQDRTRTPRFTLNFNSNVVSVRQGGNLAFQEEGSTIKMTDGDGTLQSVMDHSQGRFKLAYDGTTTDLRGDKIWPHGRIDFSIVGPDATNPQLEFSSGASINADHTTNADEIFLVDIGGTTYEIPARAH